VEPRIRLYLKDPPTVDEITDVLTMLSVEPRGLMRTKEALYRELGLKDQTLSSDDLIDAMNTHPSLIERPLVIKDQSAVLGRPPENVLSLL